MGLSKPHTRLTPAIYEAVAQRRLGQDTMVWETPALCLTAEAFLFTIALSGGNSQAARLMAAILALTVSLLAIQLMAKHRHLSTVDALLLEKLEEGEELTEAIGVAPHTKQDQLAGVVGVTPHWSIVLSSFRIWICGMVLFGAASIAVIAITATDPGLLK
jgi:hypothetical protein